MINPTINHYSSKHNNSDTERNREAEMLLIEEETRVRKEEIKTTLISTFNVLSRVHGKDYTFMDFSITYYPIDLIPDIYELFPHLYSIEVIIAVHFMIFNKEGNLEDELRRLCRKLEKLDMSKEHISLVINRFESLCSDSEEKLKTAYKLIIDYFLKIHNFNELQKNNDILSMISNQSLFFIEMVTIHLKNRSEVSKIIKNYGIKDQKTLSAIAKKAANFYYDGVSEHIQNYQIEDEKDRIEIAKISAGNDVGATLDNLHKFAITDSQAIVQIFKIAVDTDIKAVASRLWQFKLDENSRNKIEQYLAIKSQKSDLKWIQNLDMQDEKSRVENAKLAAATDENWSCYVQNYKIKDEKDRIEIAKIAAAFNARMTSMYIESYEITYQQALIEIVKISAINNLEETLFHFDKYKIIDPHATFIEIAKNAIKTYGENACKYFHDIEDEKTRIVIAKLIAAVHGSIISAYIKHYAIENEKTRIEIAKLAAAEDGVSTLFFIQNYGINDEIALSEIAAIAVSQNGKAFKNIRNVKDQNVLFSLFLDALVTSKGKAIKYLDDQFPEDYSPDLIKPFQLLNEEDIEFSKIYEHISMFCKSQNWLLPPDLMRNLQTENTSIQKATLPFVLCFLGKHALEKINPFEFQTAINFFEATLDYRDPPGRYKLISSLLVLSKNETSRDYCTTLQKEKHPSHAKIALLLITALYEKGISKETLQKQFKIASHNNFKQGQNLTAYVNALNVILDAGLAIEDSEYLLSLIDSKNMTTLHAIEAIKNMGKIDLLKNEKLSKTTLSKTLKTTVQEVIPIKQMDHFDRQFTKYFNNNRIPNFLIIYGASLRTAKQPLDCLGSCVDRILNDEYPNMRYELDQSKHLSKVFDQKVDLLEKWKAGEKASLSTFLSKTNELFKPIDFSSILKRILIDDGHLKDEDAPLLFEFIKSNEVEVTLQKIEERLNLSEDKLVLNIQKACVQLIDKSLTPVDQKEFLKNIRKDLEIVTKKNPQFNEFANDIKGLHSGLVKQLESQANYNGFTIVDTDDYQDLFLSGTEVDGSCQRVNGEAMNKCLLAYVFDGKNRLLAVKDMSGRIIARMIFRILLDDDNNPVLFLEKVYPNVVDPKLKQALEDFALIRAKSLGLPLLTDDSTKPVYGSAIHSRSTIEPILYEYTDAGKSNEGHSTKGKFTINTANQLG